MFGIMLIFSGCFANPPTNVDITGDKPQTEIQSGRVAGNQEARRMKLAIGETEVPVTWENNASVADLQKNLPLTIRMSQYGGFEQVGSIGRSIVRDDKEITAHCGDIVLYSGNKIVLFYGSNSWAYTRLGHITSQNAEGMAALLGNGNVTVTISMEKI